MVKPVLVVRSHYRVCMDMNVPSKDPKDCQKRTRSEDLSCEARIYHRKLSCSEPWFSIERIDNPVDLRGLPLDLTEKIAARRRAPVLVHCHPCQVVPYLQGDWRCDCRALPAGCLRGLKEFGRSGSVLHWRCDKCDYDMCDLCVVQRRRLSALKSLRPLDENVLVVGVFNNPYYQQALVHPMPRIFSVPLVEQAREIYLFLRATSSISKLNDPKYLASAIEEYADFIAALRKHLQSKNAEPLIPSLDVEVVWFTHMLQSAEYEVFAHKNQVNGVPHSWTLCLSQKKRAKLIAASSLVLSEKGFMSLFHVSKKINADASVFITPQQIILDRAWFGELMKSTATIDVSCRGFLQRSLLGYQRFLHLIAKYPKRLERIQFAPSPPIDLMWAYVHDSRALIFNVHHHHLLESANRTLQLYDANSEEEAVWKQEYMESYAAYLQIVPSTSHPMHHARYPKCNRGMISLVDDGLEGWRCDGHKFVGGCRRPEGNRVMDRWTCEKCDFDLCLSCFADTAERNLDPAL